MALTPASASNPRDLLQLAAAGLLVLAPWLWFVIRDWHPIFDGFALVLPVVTGGSALALALLGVFLARPLPMLVAGSLLIVGSVTTLGPWLPQGGEPPPAGVHVVAANIAGDRGVLSEAIDDVLARNADVVVISEVTYEVDMMLQEEYRYWYFPTEISDVRVYARWPVRPLDAAVDLPGGKASWVQVEADEFTFAVYALHLPKPALDPHPPLTVSLSTHRQMLEDLAEAVSLSELPVMVAGDLNLSDRAAGYRELDGVLRDAMRANWAGPTSVRERLRPFLLRIDHIFIPEDWCAADAGRFDIEGSDHRGVEVVVGPCPGAADS